MTLIKTPWDVIVLLVCMSAPMFIVLPLAGVLPDVMLMNAVGCTAFGLYTLLLPHRIVKRFAPRAQRETAEICKDLLRGWALFCLALGGAAQLLRLGPRIHPLAFALYSVVGVSSVAWDVHLMLSPHWGGKRFFLVNISVNTCLAIGNGIFWFRHRHDDW